VSTTLVLDNHRFGFEEIKQFFWKKSSPNLDGQKTSFLCCRDFGGVLVDKFKVHLGETFFCLH
jgi:hypothetical protein